LYSAVRSTSKERTVKTTAKKLLVVCFSLFFTLTLVEGFVRAFRLAPAVYRLRAGISKSAYQPDDNPILGYQFKKNYRDDHPDLEESFPLTNSDGQRDIERKVSKMPDKKRIILLGDSVVAGLGIHNIEDMISFQLQKLLGKNFEVLNFGVGGYCTRAEVELLQQKGLKYEPDLVILLFVVNDYQNVNYQVSHYTHDRPHWAEILFLRSSAFRLAAITSDLFGFRRDLVSNDPESLNRSAIGNNNVTEGLQLFKNLSNVNNFRTLVAVWPQFYNKGITDSEYPLIAGSRELQIEALCRTLSIPVFRLSTFFLKDFSKRLSHREINEDIEVSTFYTIGDTMHPSITGSHVAAEGLYEFLIHHPELIR
jgi:lysophospholipase L1-like esterase